LDDIIPGTASSQFYQQEVQSSLHDPKPSKQLLKKMMFKSLNIVL
jgi:hypothetical protein